MGSVNLISRGPIYTVQRCRTAYVMQKLYTTLIISCGYDISIAQFLDMFQNPTTFFVLHVRLSQSCRSYDLDNTIHTVSVT